jgi:N,N'-diacetyllegionaminate synthase
VSRVKHIEIGTRRVGRGLPTYVIAEVGTNHGCDLERSKALVAACADAGADAVKFQSWTVAGLQSPVDVGPQGLVPSAAWPVLEKYRLPDAWHEPLAQACAEHGVDFLSTPFDPERARFLRGLAVPALKIASGDLTYDDLLKTVAGLDTPVLLSTGMADLDEIEHALVCLGDAAARTCLLHCVSAYPPRARDANLAALRTLDERFERPVGFSDHSPGHALAAAAVALGACVVEKHVTFSRADPHPDSPFALEMEELAALVAAVRDVDAGLGDGDKRCMPGEEDGRVGGRRCAHAARDLEAGHVLARVDIAVVRPNAGGVPPGEVDRLVGRTVAAALARGAPIAWSDVR